MGEEAPPTTRSLVTVLALNRTVGIVVDDKETEPVRAWHHCRHELTRLPDTNSRTCAARRRHPLTLSLSPSGGEGIGIALSLGEGAGQGEGSDLFAHNPE
jgi:hypothetical protein